MAAYTTIDDPGEFFENTLYTGNSTGRTITTGMEADLLWIKGRNTARPHVVFDTVTTSDFASGNSRYWVTGTGAAFTSNKTDQITSVTSTGFVMGTDASSDQINGNGQTTVAYTWKESVTAGFDIVSYTGNGSARTISHSLSAVPEWMMIKKISNTDAAAIYNGANGNTNGLILAETNGNDDETYWNDTTPTSSVFTLGTLSNVNTNNETYIAFLFAPKQGYSSFGVYSGNGNANGTYVHLGFKPAWLLIKRVSGSGDQWQLSDSVRGVNGAIKTLYPDSAEVETSTDSIDHLSNGFKLRNTSVARNGSGSTYVYFAFAESPFVNSKGVPNNAR